MPCSVVLHLSSEEEMRIKHTAFSRAKLSVVGLKSQPLWRLRQEDGKLENSLGNIMKP